MKGAYHDTLHDAICIRLFIFSKTRQQYFRLIRGGSLYCDELHIHARRGPNRFLF